MSQKIKLLAALAAGLLACGRAYAAESKPAGVAVLVSGDVKLLRSGGSAPRPLAVNDSLYLGDAVEAGPGGLAALALLYGSEIRVNENTVLEFVPGSGRDEALLKSGQVWTRLLHKRGGVVIRTAVAVCAVRGTEADIESRGALTVKVYEGHVDVQNAAGDVALKAGEMARVAGPNAAPGKPLRLLPALAGRWQQAAVSADIMAFWERLKASAGGEKELDLTLSPGGGKDKGVRIKLRKKQAPGPGGKGN